MRLDVHSVAFGYRSGKLVLREISMRARPGRIVVLIGPNASGKSTFLKVLAGLLRPEAGRVELEGKPILRMSPPVRAGKMAWVPQRPLMGGRFKVAEIVAMGRYALSHDQGAVDAALVATGLEGEAQRVAEELSVGQQQRVALARALAQVPEKGVLLLDEPFAALDPAEVERAARVVKGRAAGGATVIVAVHDVRLATALGDDVIGLREGRVVVSGPRAEALDAAAIERLYGVSSVPGPEGPLPALRL